ncbi:MAG: lipoyl(octanoyl) transferase, partial [Planctomycetia bacterium]|nr:lipoyl(octanoyl) transferase [Planctomycetia bacterium]
PFRRINPCGYEGLETTSLDKLGVSTDWPTAAGGWPALASATE